MRNNLKNGKLVIQSNENGIAMVPINEPAFLSLSSVEDIEGQVDVVARFLVCGNPSVQVFYECGNPETRLAIPGKPRIRDFIEDRFKNFLSQFRGLGPIETEWIGPQVLEIRRKPEIQPAESKFEKAVMQSFKEVRGFGAWRSLEELVRRMEIYSHFDRIYGEARKALEKLWDSDPAIWDWDSNAKMADLLGPLAAHIRNQKDLHELELVTGPDPRD